MTSQEQQLIDGLIQRINSTALPDKDPDAEQRLRSGLASNPNALYVLAQTVIVQQYALDQAKQQLDAARDEMNRLRQQSPSAPPPQKHGGFLESIFGSNDRPAPPPPQQAAPSPGYSPVPNYPQQAGYPPPQQGYAPQQSYGAPSMGGGGFLRGAAQTAAGVAAGALAFEGVESLLHGFGGSGGGFGGGAPREEIVNNYYGDDDRSRDRDDRDNDRNESRGFDDRDPNDSNPGDNLFTDSDRTDDQTSGDDDTASFDDNSSDDSGSFDDGGGFDNSSSDDNSF